MRPGWGLPAEAPRSPHVFAAQEAMVPRGRRAVNQAADGIEDAVSLCNRFPAGREELLAGFRVQAPIPGGPGR